MADTTVGYATLTIPQLADDVDTLTAALALRVDFHLFTKLNKNRTTSNL
jgi:hypothetical protein